MSKYKITPFQRKQENIDKNIFPSPLRCLIIGNSGSGKTTVLWNIITKYWVQYDHLYVFTKSIEQPIYQDLQEMFEDKRLREIETYFLITVTI